MTMMMSWMTNCDRGNKSCLQQTCACQTLAHAECHLVLLSTALGGSKDMCEHTFECLQTALLKKAGVQHSGVVSHRREMARASNAGETINNSNAFGNWNAPWEHLTAGHRWRRGGRKALNCHSCSTTCTHTPAAAGATA
jgi:hypothetical protein